MQLVLVMQQSCCNSGSSLLGASHHLCGDVIHPKLTPLIHYPPTAVSDHTDIHPRLTVTQHAQLEALA